MGRNRSKYLAEYLKEKGYATRYGGVGPCLIDPEPTKPVNEEDFDWADLIITARKKHKPILVEKYNINENKIICLDVTDSKKFMSKIYPEFENMERKEFNEKWTYPQLRKEIEKYLPFEEL